MNDYKSDIRYFLSVFNNDISSLYLEAIPSCGWVSLDILCDTVKPVLSGHSKRRPKLVYKTDYRLMQVKSIAECSKGAFCNTFDLH